MLGGGLAGWFLVRRVEPEYAVWGDLAGVVLGGLIWLVADLVRGARLLQWLRLGDSGVDLRVTGTWAEVADRVRRQWRLREQATRASDARLQDFLAALQVSPNGVVLLDSQARIEWFNQTAALHFALLAERDLMQHFGNLVRDPVFARYYASQDFQQAVTLPGRGTTGARPGHMPPSLPMQLSVQLHPYGLGRLLLLSRDITAVEQAETMRRDFVANVSHEIRTPLTVLAGFVETLQTLPLNDDERTRYLGLMAQQSGRMQTLVNDLLTLSKLEGSPAVGMTEWVSLPLLMQQVEAEARALAAVLHRADAPLHRLQFDDATGWEIAASHNELQSAMANLACNAVRYTPAGGVILVSWKPESDGSAAFLVQDNGPGIAAEHLPRLTERFYRVDRSRSRDTGGTGLGLAIVKHVAQRHSAELQIDSVPGKGSTFKILFPAVRLRMAAGTQVAEKPGVHLL
jgi:two-component system, OmpR family, phosphate regulon sensor histidine kinase PhoR